MNPGQVNHTEVGLAAVPEKLRGARIQTYLSVYLQQFDSIEQLAQTVLDAIVNWQTAGAQFDWVLELIGALLMQPRPDGFTDAQYTFILQARVLVRRSTATRTDVLRVVQFLARGNPASVFVTSPKIIHVTFVNLVLTAQEQTTYEQLLLGAIDAVDKLVINYVTSATAFYDVAIYDVELYGP
jgi:hypothetical protein